MIFWNWILRTFLLLTLCSGALFAGERGSSAPFVSGDTFRAYANHLYDETTSTFYPDKVKSGDVVFVKTDWEFLERFFKHQHPRIAHPYILVTHNSDHSCPGPFRNYLDDPKLLAWFGQNIEAPAHPKLHPIPIGVANRCWNHGNPQVFASLQPLASNEDRPILCYVNFAPSTYPKERTLVWDLFAKQPWCVSSPPIKNLTQYLSDFAQSKFVLSPRGNGVDCHRTWEALLMGAIPVVRTSSVDGLFTDLPVLIVPNWEIITEKYLLEQYEVIKAKSYDREKLFITYWINNIHREAGSCQKQ